MSQLSTASESSSEYSSEYSECSSTSQLSIASEYDYSDSEGSLADFIVHDTDTSDSDSDPDFSPNSSQSTICDSETSSLKKDDTVSSSN